MTTVNAEAVRDAERVLKTLWTFTPRGVVIPVDPYRIARQFGIDVIEMNLDQTIYAALVKEQGQDPAILVNAKDSANRKRFSCAHEIGHFIRRSSDPDEYEYVDFRDLLSSASTNVDEVYSNTFAAHLLMPETEVRRFRRHGLPDYEMAVRFDVTREAMHYRLVSLGFAA